MWPQFIRRAMQLAVVGFVVYGAFGSIWRNYKLAHNSARLVGLMKGELWSELYSANEKFLSLFGEPFEASLDFVGMPWASTWFGIQSVDPILALSHIVSTQTAPAGVLIGIIVPLLLAAVAGKFFCSHLCPMRLAFDIGELVRRGLGKLGLDLPHLRSEVKFSPWILAGGLVGAVFAGPLVWLFVLPYVSLSAAIFLGITTGTVSTVGAAAAFWLAVDVLVAPGFWCKNVCPTGFVLETVGRFRLYRLRTLPDTPACPGNCRACEKACPFEFSSKDGNYESGCDSCGRCTVACPSAKIARRFGTPLAALLAVFFIPLAAQAHHNKGLPHYGYYDNYPQVPTEEYVVVDGRYEMGAVVFNFQGYTARETSDTPTDVKLYLYIFDLETKKNYIQDVDFEIRKDGKVIAEYLRTKVDEEAVYATRERLPESGTYEIVAKLDTNPPHEIKLPFYVSFDDGPNWLVIGGALLVILVIAGIGFKGRRPRKAS